MHGHNYIDPERIKHALVQPQLIMSCIIVTMKTENSMRSIIDSVKMNCECTTEQTVTLKLILIGRKVKIKQLYLRNQTMSSHN